MESHPPTAAALRPRRPITVTTASRPALRALRAAGPGGVRIAARFESTVSLSAAGLVVSASVQPVQLVCQVRVDAGSMHLLRRMAVGEAVPVDLSHCHDGLPMHLEPAAVPLARFDRPPSWFDQPDAAPGALDRLQAAATALAPTPRSAIPRPAGPPAPGTPATQDAVRRLMGLGIGLTPSGDDALVGMLAAVWAHQGRTAGVDAVAALLDRRPALTTDASLTYLRLACGGEFSQPVLRLVQALRRRTGVEHAVQHVALLGHSSGADLLAGMDGVLAAWPRQPTPDS